MIYFVILALLVVLSWQYDILGKTEKKEFWYRLLLIIFILVAGLRYRLGGDTINYIKYFYYETPYLWKLSTEDFFATEPLFLLLNSVVKSLGLKFYVVQLIQTLIVNSLVFAYVKKHSLYPFTCIFFYSIYMYFFYNFEELRASISVAICLFANDYLLDKKWLKGFMLYILGTMFHYSTVLLFVTPFFLFLKMNIMGEVIILLSLFAAFIIQTKLGDYLFLFELNNSVADKMSGYVDSDVFFKRNITIRSILFSVIPYFVYSAFAILFVKRIRNSIELLRLQPFFVLGLIFVVMSIPVPVFYRFVHFYAIYFVLLFAYLFVELIKNAKGISISLAVIRTSVLFIPFFLLAVRNIRSPFVSNADAGLSSESASKYYNYQKYYPYSSVISRSLDEDRENLYKSDGHDVANREQY